MTLPTLIASGPIMGVLRTELESSFHIATPWAEADVESALVAATPHAAAILSTGNRPIDAALMDRCPRLRIIAHFGVGYDAVDVAAARQRGIIVTNTPDVLSDEVADTTIGLLLMTVRDLGRAEQWLRAGQWPQQGSYPLSAHSLQDRSFGIVGFGRIGAVIAQRLAGFGRPISYFSRSKKTDVPYPYYADLTQMAHAVDTLILITPGGQSTEKIVNRQVLEALGPRGVVINMARGSVVDEPALIQALKQKTIAAAGLDVFWNEPAINADFLTLDNVTLLPHIGSASRHTRTRMANLVAANLKAMLAGQPPITPVPETPYRAWQAA